MNVRAMYGGVVALSASMHMQAAHLKRNQCNSGERDEVWGPVSHRRTIAHGFAAAQ